MLRRAGKNVDQATEELRGMSVAMKNELLFQNGINFSDLPAWQKRGIGLYWEDFAKPSVNPQTQEAVLAQRRRIRRDIELPMKEEYGSFILKLVAMSETPARVS